MGTREVINLLKVYLGNMPEAIYNTAVYFKNTYRGEWIVDEFCKKMILDIDKSEVISERIIESPVFGGITPRELSGGVKTLILIYNVRDKVFNASTCGDNCAKWLLEMGKISDITINLRHLMDFGNGEFQIEIMNNGKIVTNMREYVNVAGLYVR